jgi:DNA-binding response OmpR family regulator
MKASSSSGNEGKYKKLRILLVDDEPNVVEVFGRGLKLKGMRVDVYTSPQEALHYFKLHTYDLAILDIRMPDTTGFSCIQK